MNEFRSAYPNKPHAVELSFGKPAQKVKIRAATIEELHEKIAEEIKFWKAFGLNLSGKR